MFKAVRNLVTFVHKLVYGFIFSVRGHSLEVCSCLITGLAGIRPQEFLRLFIYFFGKRRRAGAYPNPTGKYDCASALIVDK